MAHKAPALTEGPDGGLYVWNFGGGTFQKPLFQFAIMCWQKNGVDAGSATVKNLETGEVLSAVNPAVQFYPVPDTKQNESAEVKIGGKMFNFQEGATTFEIDGVEYPCLLGMVVAILP